MDIHEKLVDELMAWSQEGKTPGLYLQSLLSNDMSSAMRVGTDLELACLSDTIHYMKKNMPQECWGSPTNVMGWAELKQGGVL